MFEKIWHSEALKLFSYCHHSLRNMTLHHMSHLCKETGTKCTMKLTEKPQIQGPKREGEFLICDNSMMLASINYSGAFSLLRGTGHSEDVEMLLTPPWRRPTPGGKEKTRGYFCTCSVAFFSSLWVNAPSKSNCCSNGTLTV